MDIPHLPMEKCDLCIRNVLYNFLILFTLFLVVNIINSVHSIFYTDNSNVMGIAIIASVIYVFVIGRNLFLILFSVSVNLGSFHAD